MNSSASQPNADWIFEELRERICLLDIEPGARLTEEGLAREFGVSRTPIRQALDRLTFERLVEQQHGSGARVAVLDSKELRDVWAVRLKVAELASDFITFPAPATVLTRLKEIRADIDLIRRDRDLRRLGALYNRLHETLLELISNRTLRWINDVLYHQTAREWLQFLPEMDLDAELDMVQEEIDLMLEAMGQDDAKRLAEVRAHFMHDLLARFNDHLRGTY